MATLHNRELLQSVAEVPTNARNSHASVPPAKKQRTLLSTTNSIYAPPPHEQLPLPPHFKVLLYTVPAMPLPAVAPFYWRTFPTTCTPPSFPVGYPPSFQRPPSHQQYLSAPFLSFNPNLPACASVGVATYRPARQLMEIFEFTPFGCGTVDRRRVTLAARAGR
jgi:hypothetical protein